MKQRTARKAAPPTVQRPRRDSLAGVSAPVAALVFAIIHVVLALLALEPSPFDGGDNAVYLSLARSLLERGDYTEIWDPALAPHVHFPPGFPALLALAMLLGLKPWVGLKLVIVMCSAAAVGISHLWLRRVAAPRVAFVVTALLAVSPGLIAQTPWLLSDIPFWLWTSVALYALAVVRDRSIAEADARRTNVFFGVAIVAVLFAYLTRSAATLPLLAAVTAWLLLNRRFKHFALFALAIGPLAALWWVRSQSLGAPGYTGLFLWVDPYQPQLGTIGLADFIERVISNVRTYGGRLTSALLLGAVSPAIGVIVWLLAMTGWALRLRDRSIEQIWLPLYAGLLLAWSPTWAGERLLIPLLPLLLLFAVEAVLFLFARFRVQRAAPYAFAATMLIFTPFLIREIREGMACRSTPERLACMTPILRDILLLGEDIRGKLPEGSVVLSRKPGLFFLFSGYRGRPYPLTTNADSFFSTAASVNAKYVVVDQSSDLGERYLHPILLGRPGNFCVIAATMRENAVLARIDSTGPPRAADAPPNSFRQCSYE